MDTKSNKISRHIASKSIAFVIVCLLIGIIIAQIFYVYAKGYNLETLAIDSYRDSPTFKREVNEAFHRTHNLIINENESVMEGAKFIFAAGWEDNIIASNRFEFDIEDFQGYDQAFFAYENGELSYGENTNPEIITWFDGSTRATIYIAFTDEYMSLQQEDWEYQRNELFYDGIIIFIASIISLSLIIYLMIVTGRKPESEALHSNWLDRVYTEILILFYIPLGIPWLLLGVNTFQWSVNNSYALSNTQIINIIVIGIISAVTAALYGSLLLALIRKMKDGRLIKDLLAYKIIAFLRSFFDGSRLAKFPLTKSLHQRQIIFIVASFLLVLLTLIFIWSPFALLFPLIELGLIYWYVKYNNETYKEINKGIDESLEEQMKSERMKLELITNVSHDLKTPLTSIISYVDLLSKEEEISESARDYINILADKSDRLKNIVSDLFDLAKSTSGDINLELETLDLKKLIQQTLGDMEDDSDKSGKQIKVIYTDQAVNIHTDGKKMYRVFQNVIDNALKYSLEGSRIFIELEKEEERVFATIKNTSNYEMDFRPDDILQRFNRGDKARTTDGSGLGLSIAESFTRICGGNLKIDIDGDMFKTIISFPLI